MVKKSKKNNGISQVFLKLILVIDFSLIFFLYKSKKVNQIIWISLIFYYALTLENKERCYLGKNNLLPKLIIERMPYWAREI